MDRRCPGALHQPFGVLGVGSSFGLQAALVRVFSGRNRCRCTDQLERKVPGRRRGPWGNESRAGTVRRGNRRRHLGPFPRAGLAAQNVVPWARARSFKDDGAGHRRSSRFATDSRAKDPGLPFAARSTAGRVVRVRWGHDAQRARSPRDLSPVRRGHGRGRHYGGCWVRPGVCREFDGPEAATSQTPGAGRPSAPTDVGRPSCGSRSMTHLGLGTSSSAVTHLRKGAALNNRADRRAPSRSLLAGI